MSSTKPKLIIFGIDSADWHVVNELIHAGRLPHLSHLASDGALLPLRSIIPPITSCAWPTIMTGANPGKHGMFNFVAATKDTRLLNNTDRLVPALWEVCDRHGLSVGCFSIPFTFPPDHLEHGYMIAGEMGAPGFSERMFSPPGLFEEIRRVVPNYSVELPVVLGRPTANERYWQRFVEDRRRLCMYLLKNHPTDVFIAVVNYVDYIQHGYMIHRRLGDIDDIVVWAYQQADALLGEIRRAAGDDVPIVVVSDHGAGPIEGFVDVPGLLAKLGFLAYRDQVSGSAGRRGLYAVATRAYRAIASRLPKPLRGVLRGFARHYRPAEFIDWTHTRAFYAGPYSIVVNTEGRSPHPVVPADQREAVAREVANAINDVVSPITGEKDLCAYLREELYHGPAVERCPDVIIAPRDFKLRLVKGLPGATKVFWAPEEVTGNEFITQWIEGDHRFEGILAIAPGPQPPPEVAELVDVVPTVLSLLGLPVPDYADGRSLFPEAGPRQAVQVTREPQREKKEVYSAEDAAAVEKRLRDLGYL